MDRARSSHFVWQQPRTLIGLVQHQELVEDKQLLLNETWPHYCDRHQGNREVERGQVRQKWVTETWEEYENRIPKREANIQRFFRRQAAHGEAAARELASREAATEQLLETIKQRETRRRERLLPPLHSLLSDPEAEDAEARRRQQQEILKVERDARWMVEDEERRAWSVLFMLLRKTTRELIEDIRRRKEAEEEATRQALEAERRKRQEEEAEKKRKEEEERKRAEDEVQRQKDEANRKRKELEDRRKAEQKRMKEERERQKKAEEEAEKRKRDIEHEEKRKKEEAEAEEAAKRFAGQWTDLRDRQTEDMSDFLEGLKAKMDDAEDIPSLQPLMEYAAKEMAGFMSTFGFYFGLVEEGVVQYPYASETCSDQLRTGTETLDTKQHPECPTAKLLADQSEVFVANINLPDHNLVHIGDGEMVAVPTREGDLFSIPIIRTAGEEKVVVALLSGDTCTSNNEREDWQGTHPFPNPCARKMDDAEKEFLRTVAKYFSDRWSALYTPPASSEGPALTAAHLEELQRLEGGDVNFSTAFAAALSGVAKLLNDPNVNVYISLPNALKDQLTVKYQYAGGVFYNSKSEVPEGPLGNHSFLIGKNLSNEEKPLSFGLFHADALHAEERPPYIYCPNVKEDPKAGLYSAGVEKADHYLCVVPINTEVNPKAMAVLGVESNADPGLDKEHFAALIELAQLLGKLLTPVIAAQNTRSVLKQALNWLESCTGAKNAYISVPKGSALRYIAANKPNEFLIGQELQEGEGVSHGVWHEEDKTIHITDLKTADKVKFWNPDSQGKKGELLLFGLTTQEGAQVAVLGLDTLGADKKEKHKFTDGDKKVFETTCQVLQEIMVEIEQGVVDDAQNDEVQLAIESVLGAAHVRFYKKMLLLLLKQLSGLTKDNLLEMARYNKPPETIVLVVSATLITLQHKPKAVKEWAKCRKHIKMPLIEKMNKFDATKEGIKRKNFFRKAKSMLKGLTMEMVFERGSMPASLFFQWSYISIQLRYAADLLRKKAKSGHLDLEDDEGGDEDYEASEANTDFSSTMGEDDLGEEDGEDGEDGEEGQGEEVEEDDEAKLSDQEKDQEE